MSAVKTAINSGDPSGLRQALAIDPASANTLVVWGERNHLQTHPLHYICDKAFDNTIAYSVALALAEVLIEAGANVNDQAPNRETPLLGAASLNAEDIGIRLLEAGANPNAIGIGGETALHWAAHQGLYRLVERLLAAGADTTIKDKRYDGTPLDWAHHGRATPSIGGTSGHTEAIALLQKR